MNIDEFNEFAEKAISKNARLFSLSNPALPSDATEIKKLEHRLGFSLPDDYKAFLYQFGGGDFGLTNIFCADQGNEWYLAKKVEELAGILPKGFVPFSDDHLGGFYGFKTDQPKFERNIFYWNSDGGESLTEFHDIFEFVAKYAFRPA